MQQRVPFKVRVRHLYRQPTARMPCQLQHARLGALHYDGQIWNWQLVPMRVKERDLHDKPRPHR